MCEDYHSNILPGCATRARWVGRASLRAGSRQEGGPGSSEMPRLYAMVRWGPCAEGCALACWARVGSCPQPFPCGAPGRWPDGRPGSVLATLGLVGATCPEDGCVREVDCRPAPLGAGACVRGGLHRQDPAPSGRRRAQTWAFRPVRRAEPDSDRRHAQAQAGVACRPRPQAGARLRPAPCAG